MELTNYFSLCRGMVLLLDPLVEIVVHDLATDKIIFIEGKLSQRKVGDPSLLDLTPHDLEEKIDQTVEGVVYSKLNFDGRLVKSVSIPLREKKKTRYLICINCDVSVFQQMQELGNQFLKTSLEEAEKKQPEIFFKNDWQEKVHLYLHQQLKKRKWVFNQLNGAEKKEILHELFLHGAFEEKNAADYIAKTLDVGRATIFKYLKEWREA